MTGDFRLFGALSKVEEQDDGTLKVFGVASSGARDDAGEIVLPDAMKAALPEYALYPAVREMHGPSAAGTMLEAAVDEDGFTRVCAHVVDPVAIKKVKTKTYRGFSIGGKVLERDTVDRTIIRQIKLSEISLVDRPANPEASIDLWKADLGEMTPMAYAPTNDEVKARAGELAKAAGKTAMDAFKGYVVQAREALIAEHEAAPPAPEHDAAIVEAVDKAASGLKPEERAEVLTKVAAAVEAGESAEDAVTKAIADFEASRQPTVEPDPAAVLAAAIAKAKEADKPYGDVEYADPKDGKYPIDTPAHIRAAWSYVNMPKNAEKLDDVEAVKAKIVAAWKAKIDPDGPPSAEKMLLVADLGKTAAALRLIVKSSEGKLLKGLYGVARFAEIIEALTWLQQDVAWEATAEGDGSPLKAEIADNVAALLTALAHMLAEESAEIVDAYQDQGMDIDIDASAEMEVMGLASEILDLAKADTALMEKVGARHSKADKDHIQAAHDHVAKLGAMCDPDNCPADDADKGAKADDLEKLATEAAAALTKQAADLDEMRKHAAGEAERTQTAIDEALAKFRKEPLPPKTAASTHARIGKEQDATPGSHEPNAEERDIALKAWDAMSPDDRAMALIKASMRQPVLVAR